MVLEGVVADLLNRFLGTYIDNLNASQLNIGIWGGDVKLYNLEVKETALDDLNLPVKLKFGYVQSLILKIPWKNLYTEPTIVNISELYVIIVPNQGITYNEEKWRKNEQDAKQKKLSRLEENRRNRTKIQTQRDDTFTEKLVAQVIKNLEVRIKRVHIRYEDKFSNRQRPFATGITLNSLNIQTTDEDFKFIIQREAVKIFYKLISMNHLCLYSNANSGLISDMTDKNAIIELLQSTIATENYRPEGYKYMLEPLSMDSKLKLNQKPEADESDWTIPKIDLALQLDKLALAIGQLQYQDLLLFLEAQERFNISERYLKYRPNLNIYNGHYKEWWHFAYSCILNEQIRRHKNNWSFDRMRAHRKMVRQYRDAWILFRTEKNPSLIVKNTIDEAERVLDVFNLNISRQQAEFEIDRRNDLVRVEDQKQEGWIGWAKSWFGGSVESKEPSDTDAKVMQKLEQAITPEEKQRLFEAIDYQEHTPPTDYPKHFVENRFHLNLDTVIVALEDVLEMRFTELSAQLEQRPSADAMKFTSCINNFEMNAMDQQSQQKQSILTLFDQNRSWLCIQFETNPLEDDFDQYVQLEIAPIMLKYHAPAINKTLEVFKPPESVKLHQLTALAIARYEEVKTRSATALQHMVELRKKLKLEIQIDPATIVLSAGGIFDESKPALIAELGRLQMKTVEEAPRKAYEYITDKRLSSLIAKAYDNFQLSLSDLQLIFADTFKVCMQAREDSNSCYHLLKPTGLTFDLMRSTIDDIQLPLFRLFGELPDLVLIISDDRLVKLIELFNSIPRPVFEEETIDLSAPVEGGTKLRDRAKMVAIMEVEELDEASFQFQQQQQQNIEEEQKKEETTEDKVQKLDEKPILREQQIQLDLNLILNEVGIIVNTKDQTFLSAHIRRLGLHMRKRMFDMIAQAHLGSLTLEMPQLGSINNLNKEGQTIYLIDNEMREGDHLIDITYKQATDESPTFSTEFESNEQSVYFVFQILNFNLHKEALSDLKNFNDRFQRKLAKSQQQQTIGQSHDAQTPQQPTMSMKKRTPSQCSRHSRESSLEQKNKQPKEKKKKFEKRRTRYEKEKKFVFQFRMHEIAAKLFALQNDITGGIDPEAAENDILEFCAINIQKLNLDGHMTEDGSMQVDIGLDAFTMDDRRCNAKIHRLMDKKDTNSKDKFIGIKYNQNNAGDKFVDILSSKFFILLAPEFLGVLSSFFVFKPLEDEEEVMQLPTDAYFDTPDNGKQPIQQQTSAISISTTRLTPGTPQTSPQPIAETTGTLTLNCKIYAIEVILIENSLRPEDSQAIILTFDAAIDAKNINDVQHMNGGIQHLQMYSTYFAPEKRHLINYSILKELDILFTGAIDPNEHSQKFKVSMDQLEIHVSPSVIRLLSAVTTQFSEHQKKDQTERKTKVTLSEYPGYWEPKTIAREKFWWFQTANNMADDDDQSIDEVAEDAEKSTELMGFEEQAEFSINRIAMTVEAGVNDVTRPIILLESTLQGFAQNWSTQLVGDSEARLQVSYYNETFNVWEPVIEPVLHEHTGWESWRLGLKIGPQSETDQQQQQSSSSKSNKQDKEEKQKAVAPAKMAVTIEARETMNITITKSFLQLLGQLSESFEQAAKQISPPKSHELPNMEQEEHHGTRFVNMLPMPVRILVPVEREINGGETVDMDDLIAGLSFNFTVENDNEIYDLKMVMPTPGSKGDLQVIKLQSLNSNKELCLGINWSIESSRTIMSLYTPYWMVNETGRELIYQKIQGNSTDIHHLPSDNPLILLLNESDFLGKKKTKVRIADTDWSSEFPLDTAGSSGRITCRSPTREYELSVDVQLSQSALTKVVTIMPFYLLQNDSKIAIEVREPNTTDWIYLPPESIIGFWPVQKAKRKTLIARFPNTIEESIQFPFTEAFEGFASTANDFIGLYVTVYLSDDSSVVHLEQFVPGMAPAILMNDTNHSIEYWQMESEEKKTLAAGQMIPFTWSDLLINRRLEWRSGEAVGSDELMHNTDSSYLPSRTEGYHFKVSFLNGRQRVLLFTNDAGATFIAHEAYEIEQPNMEVEFRLHGIGISLVNNMKSVEILYMAITGTQGYLGKQNGFWMQYRQSDHQTTLWVKLINFQADNQLRSAVFPCMLGMVPQPKSVVKNAPKPFLECSFVMNQSEHSNVVQIKLLEALIQEFAVRLDQHLINEILDLFPKERIESVYNKESFDKDMELTQCNLNKRAVQTRVSQAKAYYERLHISPLMMHLSFSQGHAEKKDGPGIGIQWEFLNLMLESVGVTLTEIQDVTFKLAFFQRETTFYSRNQLQSEIQSHYIRQFIKQAYVLVLGLDIIGNPFGLIRDLSTGVQDFFYQPIQGAVTGPMEFIDGMALGVHSLFSHSVGGVLGVASRITGTLGKGVAALTLDENYQRKRLQARQQPTNFGEGMFRGVRAAGQGVADGLTGVISKPVEGAKKGGVSGFLKGTGKGLIGAVTRPVSGVVDMATSVADSVKTIVTNAEETKPVRPPRVICSDKIIRPFVFEEGIGYKIFTEINKGDFAEKEHYLTHGIISNDGIFVVTDKRVIQTRQHELTGNWNTDWHPTYAEILKPELVETEGNKLGVKIQLKEPKRSIFSMLNNSKTKGKVILFATESIAKRVYERMLSAWEDQRKSEEGEQSVG